jgi:hypothetical protein
MGVRECDAKSIGAKMVRIKRQRDFGTGTGSQSKEKQRGQQHLMQSNCSPDIFDWLSPDSQPIFFKDAPASVDDTIRRDDR